MHTSNLSNYLYQKASIGKIPLNGTFELSPVCNFACRMCYVRKTPAQLRQEGKGLIPWQDWLALAKQCREAGMLYLLLTGGEPFLYPGFRQLYRALHEMGFLLHINTNGTLIDAETVEWLKEAAPSRVNITLYGASPETYQRICGRADGFQRALNAIRMIKEAGIPVVINASMIPENECDLEKILAIGKDLGLNTRMSTYMFPPVRRDRESMDSRFTPEQAAQMFLRRCRFQYSAEDYEQMIRSKADKMNRRQADGNDWCADSEFMRCRAGRSSFWINWEGKMTACGMLDFPLAVEPFREPFLDCWMRLTDAVRSTPVLRSCAGCDKRDICNPCVATIHGETGTVDQRAPYLCRMSEHIFELIEQELNVDDRQKED